MKPIRMTIQQWMIVIAVLAPLMVVFTCLVKVGRTLNAYYGKNGKQALESRRDNAMLAGFVALEQSRFPAAEARYRSALELNDALEALNATYGWQSSDRSTEILIGLADALTGQGRLSDAESMFIRAIRICEEQLGPDHRLMAESLEHYAVLLRKTGRAAKAESYERRARAIQLMSHR